MQPIVKVAIQGDKASFHEIAALKYYEQPIELVYCQSFEAVFGHLTAGRVDRAFVAVSNSNHGDIREAKQLISTHQPFVEGEYLLRIKQHVIGMSGTNLDQVKEIISHSVALSQCSEYIHQQFSGVTLTHYHDTAAAVGYVKTRGDATIVAIGSESAARLYGLTILCRSVQDDPNNATLFQSLVSTTRLGL